LELYGAEEGNNFVEKYLDIDISCVIHKRWDNLNEEEEKHQIQSYIDKINIMEKDEHTGSDGVDGVESSSDN
jgi:hypothetical protein